MTALLDPDGQRVAQGQAAASSRGPSAARAPSGPAVAGPRALDVRAVVVATVWWSVATVLGTALVAYLVGPLTAAHAQRAQLAQLRTDVRQSVGSVKDSLLGAPPVTRSTPLGDPVGLVQVSRLGLQQVVVEGTAPASTRTSPGHVPGTAGLGQPGNAVVSGRHALFGRPFADLAQLRVGDQVVVTTVQGQSLYVVSSVREDVRVRDAVADRTDGDQLTLMTASGRLPWPATHGTVVVAELKTRPFTPTPQNGRSSAQDGRTGDPSAVPLLVLCLLGLVGAAFVTTVLYRRWSPLGTYVATTPALVALLVFTALTTSRLLPAWS